MATSKPTPEEKLFAVIQGATMPPVRGKRRAPSLASVSQGAVALVRAVDLPRVNQLLTLLMIGLGICTLHPLAFHPRIETLLSGIDTRVTPHISPPLQGLKALDDYLPALLERDPFRVGQAPRIVDTPDEPRQPDQPTPQDVAASLKLVGISLGDDPTAMIEENKQTYFLRKGERIGQFTIKAILPDRVILRAGDQDVELF